MNKLIKLTLMGTILSTASHAMDLNHTFTQNDHTPVKPGAVVNAIEEHPQDVTVLSPRIRLVPRFFDHKQPAPKQETVTRFDMYDAKADLQSFIKKLRYDDGLLVKNLTDTPVDFNITLQSKLIPSIMHTQKIRVKPGNFYVLKKLNNVQLVGIDLDATFKNYFLNPTFLQDGILQLNIDNDLKEQDRNFLHQKKTFNFFTGKFSDEQINDPSLSLEQAQFRRDFNGSYDYMTAMASYEGTSFKDMMQQRHDLYEQNNIEALLAKDPLLMDRADTRIPLITHKIWVTSDDAPKDPSPQYIKWFENSIEHNKREEGWTHIFWIENKTKLPNLAKLLENHPNIQLRELDSLDTKTFVTKDLYKKAIKDKKFGKASDILRLELLRQQGGFYLDTDYELFQSLKVPAKAYDMIMGLEPMSVYLCNAFIGSRAYHPVLDQALRMIIRNLGDNAPQHIRNAADDGFKTIIETGPAMITTAFNLAAGEPGNVDIVLPPQVIYPALANEYPKKEVVVPNGKVPAEAYGAHYWNTAWMDPAYGSHG